MDTVRQYDRWQGVWDGPSGADCVMLTDPQGNRFRRPVFLDQPATFAYDDHGYESISAAGEAVLAARATPHLAGPWRYAWLNRGQVVREGQFQCEVSAHPGYVEISPHDPRYFRFTHGQPYVPIGLNLCWPTMYPMSTGREFQTGTALATLGARDFQRWFRSLSCNGGNFARLWLGAHYFQPEGEVAGELDLLRFAAIDRVIGLARQYDIRLKLCLEYFRTFAPGTNQSRVLRHPESGRTPQSMGEWFQGPDWQSLWMRKVNALLARYGDDPVVMAWELWNEIDCCDTLGFHVQEAWTRRLLKDVKAASPRNLVTNSLGSFDWEGKQALQDAFRMEEMDFQQVHRYLDQGAAIACCRTDPVAFSWDAIHRSRRPDRPVLLAETGAVNDCHTGPFRYYRADHEGILLHDTTYPAFFAGAAGSGHIWHWDCYVDQKNLWHSFRAMAEALVGVAVDQEHFSSCDLSTPQYWCWLLRGQTVSLAWVRNRADRWDMVLREDQQVAFLEGTVIDLGAAQVRTQRVQLFRPWSDDGQGEARVVGSSVHLPPFRHGLLLRIN